MKTNAAGKNEMRGLTESEAEIRLKVSGFNELPSSGPKSIWRIILDVAKEPMFILLVACGTLYMLLGDKGEGLMLLASVVIVIAITFFQEKKTERALDALRELSSPRALVIRDDVKKRIAGREVVPGDLIVLQEGDRVPADAVVLESLSLKIDESLLTGESDTVLKTKYAGEDGLYFSSAVNESCVYSGTLIVQGNGIARVTATGIHTQLGKIGKTLEKIKEEPTLLQKETRQIVKTFSVIGFGLCLFLIIIYGMTRHDWMNAVLSGLSLAMSMLPEEFIVVLTIFMAIGAWRMSKKNVLARKAASVEMLGSVTVLCADKTGTLTENRMSVRKLFANGKTAEFAAGANNSHTTGFDTVIQNGILSSQSNPFDPMEKAIVALGKKNDHVEVRTLVKEYPLTSQLFAMVRVYRVIGKKDFEVAAKGSPEAISELCRMGGDEFKKIQEQVRTFASEGLRVLGVAYAVQQDGDLPADQHDFKFSFAGLIGLEDPLRKSIPGDLAACYQAGIRVIMITGDYPDTAQHIARQMGLKNAAEVITGKELTAMNELQLREKIKTVNIFARVIPEQKLLLVERLKANGEIVAMTGDGVNDAPALRAAHVGIAMGQRGTDVAREAAGIVLLDDNFSSIVSAVRVGRRIYDNIMKAMAYVFSVHVPIAGLTLIPFVFPYIPIILFPLHIAFMELIIDPASSLIFENEEEEKDIMSHKPREINKPAFGTVKIVLSLLQGISVLLISLFVAIIGHRIGRPENEVRALTFTTLIIANLGLIFINRSRTHTVIETFREKNAAAKWVVGGALVFLFAVLYIPGLRNLFHFDFLHADDILICLAAGVAGIIWFEILKSTQRRRNQATGFSL